MPCTAWADQKWSTIPRSYLGDALAYPARMVEKYQAPLTDNTRKLLND
ncbi:hypothetical protein [Sodalis sp. (in: enterobacteria)]